MENLKLNKITLCHHTILWGFNNATVEELNSICNETRLLVFFFLNCNMGGISYIAVSYNLLTYRGIKSTLLK